MSALTLLAVLSLGGGAGEQIAEKVVMAGISRVGIIPTVISRYGDDSAAVGSLGPRALTIPQQVQRELRALSSTTDSKYFKKFEVVPDYVMRKALDEAILDRPFSVDDLHNKEAIQSLANKTGADMFFAFDFKEKEHAVTPGGTQGNTNNDNGGTQGNTSNNNGGTQGNANKDDTGPGKNPPGHGGTRIEDVPPLLSIGSEVILASDGDKPSPGPTFRDVNSLSKAAYMGESFEIRRWIGSKDRPQLQNLAIATPHPIYAVLDANGRSNWEFGKGREWEEVQLEALKPALLHPLDIDDFPYKIRVVVNGTSREPEHIHGNWVAELNPGEEFALDFTNNSTQSVMMALYIDGLSSLDRVLREPQELEANRHWVVRAGNTGRISAWFNFDPQKKTQEGNRFKIVPRDEAEAAQKGFDGNIGMITALFYSNDLDSGKYVNYPDDELLKKLRVDKSAIPASMIGVGSGAITEAELKQLQVKRGLLLAAFTIHYRSREEIDSIKAGRITDYRLAENK